MSRVGRSTQPGHPRSKWVRWALIATLATLAWCPTALTSRSLLRADELPQFPPDQFSPAQLEHFEKHVRPLLSQKCFACHGEKKQESSLRLDSRAAVLRGGDSGPAAVPGNPDDSELIRAVRHTSGIEMPPGEKLTDGQIAALSAWVGAGLPWPADRDATRDSQDAAWQSHWAFQPIRRPPLPELATAALPPPGDGNEDGAAIHDVGLASGSLNAVDRFILARLQDRGLRISPPADRRTLLRRMSFAVRGLPPSPAEIETFLSDDRPGAVERLVDRLLASPEYGERQARRWLDVARYADNKGYVFFEEKNFPWAYAYRDYVVESFNRDLPFDEFVRQQLAADQWPSRPDERTNAEAATPEDAKAAAERVGDASLRAMGFLTLGPRFMGNVHDVIDDRIDVVTRGLLGLTVGCARCHDHKYDPISQADYYGLYGVFRNSQEPDVPPLFARPTATDEYAKFAKELRVRQQKLREFVLEKYRGLIESGRTRVAEYMLAAHAQRDQPSTDNFMLIADPGDLNPALISRWRNFFDRQRRSPDAVFVLWDRLAQIADAEFARQAPEVLAALLDDPLLNEAAAGSASSPPVHPLVKEAFRSAEAPQSMADVAAVYGQLLLDVDQRWQALLAQHAGQAAGGAGAVSDPPTALPDADAEALRQVLYGPQAPGAVPLSFGWGFLTLLPDRAAQGQYQKLLKEVEIWLMKGPGAPPRAMALEDAPQLSEARVFLRGNPERLGEPASRRFLSLLDPKQRPFARGAGRLDLAEAIVADDNPLTARVIVNRIWLQLFGAGLVATPSDFGLRSDPPSHPELLDYLAFEFKANGWSLKRLQREILTSAVYRQASRDDATARRLDPENRLLWRFPRQRLDFESLRDALVEVSGRRERTLGGPAVPMFANQVVWRRSIYGFIDRQDVPGVLTTFDFPSPSASSPQRESTTLPAQALYLMNSPLAVAAADAVWRRPEIQTAASEEKRIARLYELLLGRLPDEDERAAGRDFLGESPSPQRRFEYCQALLLTNEFLFVD